MAGDGARVALDTDVPRLLAMLSVAFGRPIAADILVPLEAAASHWHRGDKALTLLGRDSCLKMSTVFGSIRCQVCQNRAVFRATEVRDRA